MSVPADRDTSADVTVSSAAAGDGADDGDISTEELLAELAAEGGDDDGAADGGKKPAGKPGKKPAPPADDDDEDEEDEDDDQDDEDDGEGSSGEDDEDEEDEDDDQDDEDDEGDDDELEGKAAKDPALAKRLAAVRRTEQRSRDRIAHERAAFDAEKSAWQAETKTLREEVQRFRALAARATYDPASVLKALGVSEDDMEYAGQQVFSHSKAAAAKGPQHRAAADQARREREQAGELAKTAGELAQLRKQLEERDQQAEQAREADMYMSRVVRKASDATPRVKALIAKSPKRARVELTRTAFELAQKLGSLPKAKVVLAAHEKKITRQLRAYGVDNAAPANAGKKPNGNGNGGAAAGAKPAGKPGKPGAKPNAGAKRSARNEIEHPSAADLIRELADGALDADT